MEISAISRINMETCKKKWKLVKGSYFHAQRRMFEKQSFSAILTGSLFVYWQMFEDIDGVSPEPAHPLGNIGKC